MSIPRHKAAGIPITLLLASLVQGADLPLAILDVSPDTGRDAQDGITSSALLHIHGQGRAGGEVAIAIDNRPLGTTQATPEGLWTFEAGTTTPLVHGQHILTASVGSGVGQRSSSFIILVDTRAPAAPTFTTVDPDTGSSPTDWITSDRNVLVRGRAEAGSTVTLRLNDADLGSIAVSTTGDWSMPLANLDEGSHSLLATAVDAAGNASTGATRILRIDGTPPGPPIISSMTSDTGANQADRVTRDVTPTLSGTTEAGANVTVLVDGVAAATARASSTGAWSATTAALGDGTHHITVVASDSAGHASPESEPLDVTIKTVATPPTITFSPDTGAGGDSRTNASRLTFSGWSGDGVSMSISLNGRIIGRPTPTVDGTWSLDWSGNAIEVGTHAVVATAIDLAGNQTAAVLNLTIDSTPPAAPTALAVSGPLGPQEPLVAGETLVISGRSEPGAIVAVGIDGTDPSSTILSDATGRWQLPWVFTAGSHQVSAFATDAAGNPGAPATVSFQVVEDSGGGGGGGGGGGNQVTIQFSGIVTQLDDLSLTLGGEVVVGQMVTGSYTYRLDVPNSATEPGLGNYRLTEGGQGITVTIGTCTFASAANLDVLIQVVDNYNSYDRFLLRSYRNQGSRRTPDGVTSLGVENIGWQLEDPSMRALDSVALPTTPLHLPHWQSPFGMDIRGARVGPLMPWSMRIHVQSVWMEQPAPAPGNG